MTQATNLMLSRNVDSSNYNKGATKVMCVKREKKKEK